MVGPAVCPALLTLTRLICVKSHFADEDTDPREVKPPQTGGGQSWAWNLLFLQCTLPAILLQGWKKFRDCFLGKRTCRTSFFQGLPVLFRHLEHSLLPLGLSVSTLPGSLALLRILMAIVLLTASTCLPPERGDELGAGLPAAGTCQFAHKLSFKNVLHA